MLKEHEKPSPQTELQDHVAQLNRKLGALARAQKAQKNSRGDETEGVSQTGC